MSNDRAVGKRYSREETKQQIFSEVVRLSEKPNIIITMSMIADNIGMARSTYVINMLMELYIEDKIDCRPATNSRGNLVYYFSIDSRRMMKNLLPFEEVV